MHGFSRQSVYNLLLVVFVAAIILEQVNGRIKDACKLPNGKKGTCVSRTEIKQKENSNKRVVGAMSQQMCQETYNFVIGFGTGGVNATAQQFKHMAALGYGDAPDIVWACGGSLISKRFVMTAAHCIESQLLGRVKHVRLGDLNLRTTTDDAQPQDFEISNIIVHPEYVPPHVYNDIALIELHTEAKYSLYVRPACLNTDHWIATKSNLLIATGWGITSYDGPQADHLQEMYMREVPIEECRNAFRDTSKRRLMRGVDGKTQLCAGAWSVDTCQGDSGGPLQVRNQYIFGYTVVGITSFGKQCGLTEAPGIYTRVSRYVGWIESVVWPQ